MLTARHDPSLTARIIESFTLEGVRAGSALVDAGGRLLLVQDDALSIAWVLPDRNRGSPAIRLVVLEGHGGPLPKAAKPDFEAAFIEPSGGVVVLGSGSKSNRRRIARIDPDVGQARVFDADPLYDALGAALGDIPNIEGAVVLGEEIRFFHRGSGAAPSATIDAAVGSLHSGLARILSVSRWDLGTLPGPAGPVALHFTDAAPGPDGRIHWLAAAEDTPNAIDDGLVVGAVVGVMYGGEARFTPLLESDGSASVRKAEGIALSSDGLGGWLVTDPDDASRPAELCRFVLEGPW
jgi:hypothetical protein